MSIYQEWSKKFVHERVEKAESFFEENPQAKPKNVIETIIKDKMTNDEHYTEEDIINEFSTFFFAGTDTTANYLQGMIYLVAKHP